MENPISISNLNDFIFCPASIYYHGLYNDYSRMLLQNTDQINGTAAHTAVDNGNYTTSKHIITDLSVYSEEYNLIGKIDMYDGTKKELVERKKHIKVIYDGYIFQLYGQYFALREMGYIVEKLALYSYDDNKKYRIPLPESDETMLKKFRDTIYAINNFNLVDFEQTNTEKCMHCIYEPLCDKSLSEE